MDYGEALEARNGYCECPDLSRLFALRRRTTSLEGMCDFLRPPQDLINNRFRRLFYDRTVDELHRAVEGYYELLVSLVDSGKLELKDIGTTNIRTINCSGCDQQVDMVS